MIMSSVIALRKSLSLTNIFIDHYTQRKAIDLALAKKISSIDDERIKFNHEVKYIFRGLANISKAKLKFLIGEGEILEPGIAMSTTPVQSRDMSWTTEAAVAVQFATGLVGPEIKDVGYSCILIGKSSKFQPILNPLKMADSSIGSHWNPVWKENLGSSILNEKEVIITNLEEPELIVFTSKNDSRELSLLVSKAVNILMTN
jgi:hypothetical protein